MLKLESSRLILKSPNLNFAPLLLEYCIRNQAFLRPWTPLRSPDFFTLHFQEALLNNRRILMKSGSECRFYIFKKEGSTRIIGDLAFSSVIKGAFQSCFLGYALDKDEVNQGYMEEALKVSISYIFETLQLHRVEANVMPRNVASIRLLEKLNFEQEGLSKKYFKINGQWEDHLHFVLLNNAVE